MNASSRQVSLPDHLYTAIERKFGSVEPFLVFVLGELLRDDAAVLDQEEQRMVEQRLRDLGYL
ncbi:MAG TPA: hypothetical protein VKG65_09120 [Terriglobales bacterium]|nr:hypothetical protein [Terriglobales bacterium]